MVKKTMKENKPGAEPTGRGAEEWLGTARACGLQKPSNHLQVVSLTQRQRVHTAHVYTYVCVYTHKLKKYTKRNYRSHICH